MTASDLPSDFRDLPISDRIALIERIWDSIAEDEAAFQFSDAQKAELDLRLARRELSQPRGSDWGDVKKRILGEP